LKLEKELVRTTIKLVGKMQPHCNVLELYSLENLTREFGCIEELNFIIGKYLKTQIVLKMKLIKPQTSLLIRISNLSC